MKVLPVNMHRRLPFPERVSLVWGLIFWCAVLVVAFLLSIAFGAAKMDLREVWASLIAFDLENTNHLIILTLRLPRALTAVLVGAALGVAGAVMQGLTRNPLADPGLLGIHAGATLAVVGGVFLMGIHSLTLYALFAFAGGAAASAVVYGISALGSGGVTPLKLTIAGAAFSTLLGSITTAILIFHQRSLDEVRFWLAGSVAGRDLDLVAQALPWMLLGLLSALLMGRQIRLLSMGEDVARGLGQNVGAVKFASSAVVVILAGSSVALAGPIGFIGLIVPHLVRIFVGTDYRWLLPFAAVVGAVVLVVSDLIGRVLVSPLEIPVGIVTAGLGGPLFIYLVQRKVNW